MKAQRELLQLRNSSLENEEQLRIELAASKSELADTRQKLGVAEGKQDELRVANQRQHEELAGLRLILAKQETQLALFQREVELANIESKQLQENITLKPAMPKVARRNRKG